MNKSKTKIEKQLSAKTSPEVIRTVIAAKKALAWIPVAAMLTTPSRKRSEINLTQIEKADKDVVICGKVLSIGEINKKKKVVALNFSKKAEEKLKNAGCEITYIRDEIKKNPGMENLVILTGEKNDNN